MTLIVCVICGHKVEPLTWDCPRCERDGQKRLKGARVVGLPMNDNWIDPTIH